MNVARASATIGLTIATVVIVAVANSSFLYLPTYSTPVIHYGIVASLLVAISVTPFLLYRSNILKSHESSRLYFSEVVGLEISMVVFVIFGFTGRLVMSGSFSHVYAGLGSLVLLLGVFDGLSFFRLRRSHQGEHGLANPLNQAVSVRSLRNIFIYFNAPSAIAIFILIVNNDYIMAAAVGSFQVLFTILALVLLDRMR